MALTTLQFWQQELSVYQAEQAQAQSDLTVAQTAQKTANTNLAKDLKSLDQASTDITALRAQLGQTTIPAEASALVAKITAKIIAQRGLQGTVLDDQGALDAATANVDAANATLARTTARVASTQAAVAQATTDDAQRTALKKATVAAPLSTLKSDASTFSGGATVTKATAHITKIFQTDIATIAGKRYDTRSNRIASLLTVLNNAQDALGADLAADGGLQGVVTQKKIAFQRAQDALSQYVASAANRFAKAQAVMKMLETIELAPAGTVPDVLTDAEKAQLASSTLKTPGAAAKPTAEAIDLDLDAVFAAQDALDAQILIQIKADVDKLATDATVAAKRAAIGTAVTTYTSALTAFTTKSDLDNWEAVIPDPAWKVLLDFEDAAAALVDLSAVDPATLATTMDTAENDYATALAAAGAAQRRSDYYGDAIGLCEERLAAAQAAIGKRLASAIRGDSY